MSKHTISIINNTGTTQNYALFNQAPKVLGEMQGQIWSTVNQTVIAVPDMEEASFEMYLRYHGVAGSFDATPSNGAHVTIDQARNVTMGSKKEDGTEILGSTLETTINGSILRFDPGRQPGCAPLGAFELRTASDFTSKIANEGKERPPGLHDRS
ncbi:hypothetical protein PVAG01_02220 [Phlyctema vagabunda]|uniref:Uncharacterized protein n=1 Tax=Phlyctema vagabunda TaxID=108571 RepID=A0ABR4PPX9_9HELO